MVLKKPKSEGKINKILCLTFRYVLKFNGLITTIL